ncbi:MgtC/SapB family protein [Acidicapsa acidisoli]|uniref:MgtC/SapB family protein n=1 Tax=Acidicapsa acidisoli TaxID=1615681 RepID=UPI0021DFEB13|nr:MgtC/SapB family protein [Acidicapsa acidisoli]
MTGIIPAEFAAILAQPFSFGELEQNLVSNQAVERLLVACALGTVVGIEREWKAQSAGVRTNLLICMGCAFFTLMSAVLAGDTGTNKGQVASNIVQGIGFLGAGLILHNKSRVSGLASAASIFVVASIGMACGAGLFLPAVIATFIVVVAMLVIGFVEWKVSLKAYPLIYEARGSDETNMLISILDAMDKEQQRLAGVDRDEIGVLQRVSFSLSATKRRHERLRSRLLAEPAISELKTFRDPEED